METAASAKCGLTPRPKPGRLRPTLGRCRSDVAQLPLLMEASRSWRPPRCPPLSGPNLQAVARHTDFPHTSAFARITRCWAPPTGPLRAPGGRPSTHVGRGTTLLANSRPKSNNSGRVGPTWGQSWPEVAHLCSKIDRCWPCLARNWLASGRIGRSWAESLPPERLWDSVRATFGEHLSSPSSRQGGRCVASNSSATLGQLLDN